MSLLLTCYLTIFIIIIIISLTQHIKKGFFVLLSGLLFFGIIYYLVIGHLLDTIFLLASLLLGFVLLGGQMVCLTKKNEELKESLSLEEKENLHLKEQNRLFVENTPDFFYRISLHRDLSFTYLSPQVEDITGFSPQDFYQNPQLFLERIHLKDRSLFKDITQEKNPTHEKVVLGFLTKEKEEDIYLEFHHHPIYGREGELLSIEGLVRDVTTSVLMKKELQTTEKRLQLILERMREGLIITDGEGQIRLINDKGAHLTGWSKKRALGSFLHQVFSLTDEQGHEVESSELHLERPHFLLSQKKDERWAIQGFQSSLGEGKDGSLLLFGDITREYKMKREYDQRLKEHREKIRELQMKKKRDLLERRGVENKLKEYSLRLASILDASPAAILTQNLKGEITSWNRAAEEIFGYKKEEIIHKELPLLTDGTIEESGCYFQQVLKGESLKGVELKCSRRDSSPVDVNLSALPLTNGEGEVIGVLSIILDMTEEKRAKKKIVSFNYQDPLTGIYNRAYMEREIKYLDQRGTLPISAMIMDINGLRIINEAFGHSEGNRILRSVARIIKRESREEDCIGRWGSDEFLLLLPGVSREELERISRRIESTDLNLIPSIPISLTLNSATKEDSTTSLEEIIGTVEDGLYFHHQEQIQTARDMILSSMLKMLSQVSDETEEHTWRMQSLAMEMGELLHLSEMELEHLSLLVPLHDIGKITIDQEILLKEEALTQQEWELVKTHAEAGYFIAHSSEAFSHVAEAILSHHEWWDGLGYPKGLKGGEIPLISRILSIIDAFDTMTYKRKYGDCLTAEEALREMKKYAGRQFDPHLLGVFFSYLENKEDTRLKRDDRKYPHQITARQQLRSNYLQIQALSRRLLHAQEEEMARLARDLHDDIGQNMTALKLDLELLNTEIGDYNHQLKRRLTTTIDLVDSLIEHIRNQASALRPPVLDDIGLLAAINTIVDRYQRSTKIEFHLYQEGMEERFSREVETVLYRCIQESLTNIVRHSKAQQVEIELIHDSSEITALIRDDGCGFELENLEISSDHIGLTGMKERVQLINGHMVIHSKPKIGTEVFISVPI